MKIKTVPFLLLVLLLLSGCNSGIEPEEQWEEVYSAALDMLMEEDHGLNGEMEYIAVDMSESDVLKEADKEEIISYMKDKYKVDVMEATLEELKQQGYYDEETRYIKGVLLHIEKMEVTFTKKVVFTGSKFKSAKGSVRIKGTLHYKGGVWKGKETDLISIS